MKEISQEEANWTHKQGSSPHYQGQIYDEVTGKTIAITYNDEGGQNAALLASAPDLLAALESLLEQVDALRWIGEIKEQAESTQCKQARAAISKAKGEEQP